MCFLGNVNIDATTSIKSTSVSTSTDVPLFLPYAVTMAELLWSLLYLFPRRYMNPQQHR
jgi:hypothetical protein